MITRKSRLRWNKTRRGQGMLEFALAIPVFLLLVLGIIEFGRMFLMYTSLFAAAREGARYGAAVETLCDHAGLQDAARRVGFFAGDMNIGIQYDDGYGNEKACEKTVLGDRVHVTVSTHFRSITGIIPDLTLHSTARRTIIKQVFLEWTLEPTSADPGSIPSTITPGGPSGTNTATHTPTNTPGPGSTATRTPTITNTPTITMTPTPVTCSGTWNLTQDDNKNDEYYDLTITNNSGVIRQLTKVSISWGSGRVLKGITYSPPQWTELWGNGNAAPDDDTSPFTYFIPEGDWIEMNPGSTYIIRFTFTKSDKVTGVELYCGVGDQECKLSYP